MKDEQLRPVAVILAAGVGRRLGETHEGPKVLLEFGGISLLQRTLAALHGGGVRRVSITIGYQGEKIRDAITKLRSRSPFYEMDIQFIVNPDFREGSLVSLHVQAPVLMNGGEVLLMDGDVLYDPKMVPRLLAAGGEGVLLVDRDFEPGDEPVKVCFDADDRIVDFHKVPRKEFVRAGESVGFFKFSPALACQVAKGCAGYMALGEKRLEYEEVIRDLILAQTSLFTAVDVSDLSWTEIDFQSDIEKARDVVLGRIAGQR